MARLALAGTSRHRQYPEGPKRGIPRYADEIDSNCFMAAGAEELVRVAFSVLAGSGGDVERTVTANRRSGAAST
jgi:hypothetical protein